MLSEKMRKMNGENWHRKAVCRRCGCVMSDAEDFLQYGQFWHPYNSCVNRGGMLDLADTKEVAEFVRKRIRRAAKRAGTSV